MCSNEHVNNKTHIPLSSIFLLISLEKKGNKEKQQHQHLVKYEKKIHKADEEVFMNEPREVRKMDCIWRWLPELNDTTFVFGETSKN